MRYLAISAVVLFWFAVSVGAQVNAGKYVNFDAPGAMTSVPAGAYVVGTEVSDMNNQGQVIGTYSSNSSIKRRGFVRDAQGIVHLLDDPSAGIPSSDGPKSLAITLLHAINDAGTIVGMSLDPIGRSTAFIRRIDGTFQDFQCQPGYPASAESINNEGVIFGGCGTGSRWNAMIRKPDGTFVTFSAPDSSAAQPWFGTYATSINNLGLSTGSYYDSISNVHAFVRAANGAITEFSAPGAGTNAFVGTWPMRIFDSGAILGFYADDNWNQYTFIRLPDGTFLPVGVPPASGFKGVIVEDIDWWGDLIGTYTDANGAYHAFYRTRAGVSYIFSDPAAGIGAGQGTVAVRMNAWGDVAGNYIDANNLYHGFVWKPFAK